MSDNLFSAVLANEFEDTAETIVWLVDNGYISYQHSQYTIPMGYQYARLKHFKWKGLSRANFGHLLSTHFYNGTKEVSDDK